MVSFDEAPQFKPFSRRHALFSSMLRLASLLLIPAITTAVLTTTWSDLQANPTFSFADYVVEYRNHGKVVCACGV